MDAIRIKNILTEVVDMVAVGGAEHLAENAELGLLLEGLSSESDMSDTIVSTADGRRFRVAISVEEIPAQVVRPSAIPPSKISLTYGLMPTRAVYDLAWGKTWREGGLEGDRFPFGMDLRVGTVAMTRDQLWGALLEAHAEAVNGAGDAASAAGSWCSDVLGALGVEWV